MLITIILAIIAAYLIIKVVFPALYLLIAGTCWGRTERKRIQATRTKAPRNGPGSTAADAKIARFFGG